jgi:hypothetical protein
VLLPLAAAILVGGILVLLGPFGDGDDSGGDQAETSSDEAEAAAVLEEARAGLTESLNDKPRGIAARFPETWRSTESKGAHVLESGDACIAVTLAAPAGVEDAGRLRRDAISVLRGNSTGLQVSPGEKGKQVGGIPTVNDVITLRNRSGRNLRVLLAVGKGERFAYVTEVVLRDPSCSETLLESQLIVTSIRYTR